MIRRFVPVVALRVAGFGFGLDCASRHLHRDGAEAVGLCQARHASRARVHRAADKAWVKNPVDAFILSKLQQEGLKPSPPADRRTLLRRVYFDLIGLPPTPAEMAAFLADKSPDAYAKVVEKLLASPHYGERWGQHWLDVVRFAETDGYEYDTHRGDAWRTAIT